MCMVDNLCEFVCVRSFALGSKFAPIRVVHKEDVFLQLELSQTDTEASRFFSRFPTSVSVSLKCILFLQAKVTREHVVLNVSWLPLILT